MPFKALVNELIAQLILAPGYFQFIDGLRGGRVPRCVRYRLITQGLGNAGPDLWGVWPVLGTRHSFIDLKRFNTE